MLQAELSKLKYECSVANGKFSASSDKMTRCAVILMGLATAVLPRLRPGAGPATRGNGVELHMLLRLSLQSQAWARAKRL